MYVYIQSEPGLYTVGHYEPGNGKWIAESDHESRDEAAARVCELNGFGKAEAPESTSPGFPALRDMFAGQALAGLLAAPTSDQDGRMPLVYWSNTAPMGQALVWNHQDIPKALARLAYEAADAMIAARDAK